MLSGYDDLLPLCLVGVEPNIATQGGDTALHWAVVDGHTLCALLLLQRGARVLTENGRGESVVRLSRGKDAELERLISDAEQEELKRRAEEVAKQATEVAFSLAPSQSAASAPPPKRAKMTIKLKQKT